MRVAVENYEMYNNGILLCKWFDTNEVSLEEVTAWCKEIAINSGFNGEDMELFVADYEDDLGLYSGECLINAYKVTEQLESVDASDYTPIKLMLDNGLVSDIEEAIEKVDECHCTGETRMEDVAYNYVQECGLLESMPSSLQCYFDYESLGRDMEIEGTYLEANDGTLWEYIS